MVFHFMHVSLSSSATNPELKKSAKVEHGFKVTSDGRLIIREDDEEDGNEKGERIMLLFSLMTLFVDDN